MYLLDTVVISEMPKRKRDPGVISWLADQRQNDLFVSVITLGEIRRGIWLQEKKNPAFAMRLQEWLDAFVDIYASRLLPVTQGIAMLWGMLSAQTGNNGMDNLIAATAIAHKLTVVTRNIRHFQQTGVSCFNPWH